MLHIRQAGSGPDVLLLHAFPLNGRMWEPQLGALSDRVRLLAPDMPGFGLSPAAGGTPSMDDYAREVLAGLDALHVERVVVCGLSMGGYLAFRLLEPLGARLAGLLLADTRAGPDTEEAARVRHDLAARVEAEGVEVAIAEFLPKLLGATTLATRPAVVARVREIIRENSPAGVAGALRAMAVRPDSTPLLSRISCPTICLAGEEDAITSPEVARGMAERIPGARTVVVPAAGHLANLEQPVEFNEALQRLMIAARE